MYINSRLARGVVLTTVSIRHLVPHPGYECFRMPVEALDIIRAQVDTATPSGLVDKIQDNFPNVTSKQIGQAWSKATENLWKRAENPMDSATALIQEYPREITCLAITPPDGVIMLAFAVNAICSRFAKEVVEAVLDATCECLSSLFRKRHSD
jgi:hypothetical protein